MIDLNEIHSLTDFQRNTKGYLGRLKASGKPFVLIVKGKAGLVVQDAASYQKVMELVERPEAIEGVRKGLEAMRVGKGTRAGDFVESLQKQSILLHSDR